MGRAHNIPCLLLLSLSTAGALSVRMGRSPVTVLRGGAAVMPCAVLGLDSRTVVEVYWIRRAGNGSQDVFHYLDGEVKVAAPRFAVEKDQILRGNAALRISDARFEDEGEYTCAVVNTPREELGRATLQVSARPSVSLAPDVLHVELDTEKSALCEVTNVYPHTVTIRWVRSHKDSPGRVALDKGTCTTDPIANGDGTFNITSHLTLNPQKEDDGERYSCIVAHRSLDAEIVRNFTLMVTERKDYTAAVLLAIFGTLLCTLLTIAAMSVYLKVVRKDPPTLCEFTGNDQLIDMSPVTLSCHIMNYRPDDISISVHLRRSGEQEIPIYTWRSRDHPARLTGDNGGRAVSMDMEERGQLVDGALTPEERPLQLKMVPVVSRGKFGLFSCQCYLHITPSCDLDHGAELSVRVTHPAMTSPVSVRRRLNVRGVAPQLWRIVTPGRVIHDERVTLTCPIMGFKPRALSISWLRRERDNPEAELLRWDWRRCVSHSVRYSHNLEENGGDDQSHSFLSALTLRATVREDDGVTYICRTHHPATGQRAERRLDMAVTAAPVLDAIQKSRELVSVGDPLSLSCRIHSFYPRDIQVTWYREDGEPLPADTAEALQEESGLYHVSSTVSYTPTIRDKGKTFRCAVQHGGLTTPKLSVWTLREVVSPPSVGDIHSDPAHPDSGESVTLSCAVRDMYPEAQHIHWFRGLTKLPSELQRDTIKQDPDSRMYCGTAELTLTPSIAEHGDHIRLEIAHSAKTVTREFTVHLKGLPVVGEISSDPVRPQYGRTLTLRCCVSGSDPRDIAVTWSEGRGEVSRGDAGSMFYTLTITPTAEHHGKVYSCCVAHTSLPQPIRRKLHLRLPDKPPTLSDISVRPARATANQEASFCVMMSGFSPQDILVRWYKGFSLFPGNAVTSSVPQIVTDGLYASSSTLTFTPTPSDHNSPIRCEVTHNTTKSIQERRLTLNLSGNPDRPDEAASAAAEKTTPTRREEPALRIEKIECRTERPLVGGQVTLMGRVSGCEAEGGEFSWYKGMFPIDGETEKRQHGSSCTSSISFTVQESDANATIRLEVTYNYQTVGQTYLLRLG